MWCVVCGGLVSCHMSRGVSSHLSCHCWVIGNHSGMYLTNVGLSFLCYNGTHFILFIGVLYCVKWQYVYISFCLVNSRTGHKRRIFFVAIIFPSFHQHIFLMNHISFSPNPNSLSLSLWYRSCQTGRATGSYSAHSSLLTHYRTIERKHNISHHSLQQSK